MFSHLSSVHAELFVGAGSRIKMSNLIAKVSNENKL
jgi:hypothetical protein